MRRLVQVEPAPEANVEALDGARGVVRGVWAFEVPGPPQSKARPRFGRARSGRVVTFTDSKTVAYENLVALMAARALPPGKIAGSISIAIVAKFARQKKAHTGAIGQLDVDNIAKAILDGLKHHFNDRQVTCLLVTKSRVDVGEEPRTLVRVEEIAE